MLQYLPFLGGEPGNSMVSEMCRICRILFFGMQISEGFESDVFFFELTLEENLHHVTSHRFDDLL